MAQKRPRAPYLAPQVSVNLARDRTLPPQHALAAPNLRREPLYLSVAVHGWRFTGAPCARSALSGPCVWPAKRMLPSTAVSSRLSQTSWRAEHVRASQEHGSASLVHCYTRFRSQSRRKPL